MRWLLLLLIALPAVAAHGERLDGDYLPHIRLAEVELAPGQTENWTLAYQGVAMQEGWHWLIRADVEGRVRVVVAFDGGQSASWQWGSGLQSETLVISEAGHAEMTVTNIGQENATLAFYYDHTCDCSAKAAPLSPGMLWLNTDAKAGEKVTLEMFITPTQATIDATPMPRHINVTARYVEADAYGGYVPRETKTVAMSMDDPFCEAGTAKHPVIRWNGCMELAFKARHDGQQLMQIVTDDDAPSWHILVMPNIEVTGKEAPVPLVLVMVAMVLVGAWCRRR